MTIDHANALFELAGSVFIWLNVWRLVQDRRVQGVSLWVAGFYCAWGGFSCFYYLMLAHWWSLLGQVVMVAGNCVWLVLALRYRQSSRMFSSPYEGRDASW